MIGLVRTRIAAVHSPSPLIAGCTGGEMSSGRFGIVVVDVVVVAEGSGTNVVVVEEGGVVEVVVEVVVDSVDGAAGHDCVATVGTRRAGAAEPAIVEVVTRAWILESVGAVVAVVEGVVVVPPPGTVSKVMSAKESAGATAGASLCVQVSS